MKKRRTVKSIIDEYFALSKLYAVFPVFFLFVELLLPIVQDVIYVSYAFMDKKE